MKAPLGGGGGSMKKGDKKTVVPGMIIDRAGTDFVVGDDGGSLKKVRYIDSVEDPFVVFEWRYMTRGELKFGFA